MRWLILSNLPQLSPPAPSKVLDFGSEDISRSCQILDGSEDLSPRHVAPNSGLGVAMALQSRQDLENPQHPTWVCGMENGKGAPFLVQTVNTDGFEKGEAGALVF